MISYILLLLYITLYNKRLYYIRINACFADVWKAASLVKYKYFFPYSKYQFIISERTDGENV